MIAKYVSTNRDFPQRIFGMVNNINLLSEIISLKFILANYVQRIIMSKTNIMSLWSVRLIRAVKCI